MTDSRPAPSPRRRRRRPRRPVVYMQVRRSVLLTLAGSVLVTLAIVVYVIAQIQADRKARIGDRARADAAVADQQDAAQAQIRQLACIFASQVDENAPGFEGNRQAVRRYRAFYHCPPYSTARARNPIPQAPPTIPPLSSPAPQGAGSPPTASSVAAPSTSTPAPSTSAARPRPSPTPPRPTTSSTAPRSAVTVSLPIPLPTLCLPRVLCVALKQAATARH